MILSDKRQVTAGVPFDCKIKECFDMERNKKNLEISIGLERQLNTFSETKMRDLKSHYVPKIDNDINNHLLRNIAKEKHGKRTCGRSLNFPNVRHTGY